MEPPAYGTARRDAPVDFDDVLGLCWDGILVAFEVAGVVRAEKKKKKDARNKKNTKLPKVRPIRRGVAALDRTKYFQRGNSDWGRPTKHQKNSSRTHACSFAHNWAGGLNHTNPHDTSECTRYVQASQLCLSLG